MGNILIMGNGISIRFNNHEYNYASLINKFIQGLNLKIKQEHDKSSLVANEEIANFVNSLRNDEANLNESFFFKTYKAITLYTLKTGWGGTKITSMGFDNAEQCWDMVYKAIIEGDENNSLSPHLWMKFYWPYEAIIYGILRSICISNDNMSFTEINYTDKFLENLKSYDDVITTNYYLGLNVPFEAKFIHGEISFDKNFQFTSKVFGRKQTEGNEFLNKTNELLFGSNYNDKVFLNSILKWRNSGNVLKRHSLKSLNQDFADATVDIVGLSVEGDKEFIEKIIAESKKCNVFCYSEKDKTDWTKIVDGKGNCEIFDSSEFPGFK